MRFTMRQIASLILLSSLTGCAALYNAKDDSAAQGVSKAFNDAEIGKALDAERAVLITNQAARQGIVSRANLALRDARLAQLIDATNAEESWGFLNSEIDARIKKISGKADFAKPQECDPDVQDSSQRSATEGLPGKQLNKSDAVVQFGLARRKLETVLANTKEKRSQVATKFASISDAPALTCVKDKPVTVPVSLQNDEEAIPLLNAFNKQCKSAVRAAECVAKWSTGPSGLLADINSQLDAIEVVKQDVDADVSNKRNEYKKLLASKPGPEPGAAEALAQNLKTALEKLEKIPFSSTNKAVSENPVFQRIAESGRLKSLEEKQDLLETYIDALKGKESGTPTIGEHRVVLIANLVNRATGKPTPPTAGILMEAEFTRQQIAASEKRIERATLSENILRSQRDYLLDELEFLFDTKASIKAAAGGCTGKSIFTGISSGATNRCSTHSASAALSFAAAFTAGRIPAEQSEYLLIDQVELAALDESEAALLQTEGVVKAAIAQIVALNASGIKPEDLAAVVQAFSLPIIAARVK